MNTVAPADAERAISVIVLAFSADPMARWTYPDAQQFLTHFPALVRAFGGAALESGTAYEAGGFAGAALWLPPDVHPDEEALGARIEASTPSEQHADLFGVLERMGELHPKEPHWYLPLIGVQPAYQGSGHGSALLAHSLRACDRDHLPAYLESSNPANIPLYERHGFVVVNTIQVGSSPTVHPMRREAR